MRPGISIQIHKPRTLPLTDTPGTQFFGQARPSLRCWFVFCAATFASLVGHLSHFDSEHTRPSLLGLPLPQQLICIRSPYDIFVLSSFSSLLWYFRSERSLPRWTCFSSKHAPSRGQLLIINHCSPMRVERWYLEFFEKIK